MQLITFLFIILMFCSQANAIFINAVLYRNTSNGHLLIRLDDIHLDVSGGKITKKQHAMVLEAAKELNATVIVEDPNASPSCFSGTIQSKDLYFLVDTIWSYEEPKSCLTDSKIYLVRDINKFVHDLNNYNFCFQPAFPFSPLLSMVEHCHAKRIPFYNVDCRKATNISMFYASPFSKLKMTLKQAMEINEQVIEHIQTWDLDPYPLQKFYQDSINEYRNNDVTQYCINLLQEKPDCEIHSMFEKSDVRATNKMLLFDSTLVDPFLLHAYYIFRDNPVLISCAGGAHHERIEALLPALGFEKIIQTGIACQVSTTPEYVNQYIVSEADISLIFKRAMECYSYYQLGQQIKEIILYGGAFATGVSICLQQYKKAVIAATTSLLLTHLVIKFPGRSKLAEELPDDYYEFT